MILNGEGWKMVESGTRDQMSRAELLSLVKYRDWTFHVGRDGTREFLQIRFPGKCAHTGVEEIQHGRKWLLSPHMTKSELISTAFKAVLTAEEHEVRENFRYRGEAIFGPHFDVDGLVELAGTHRLDVRKNRA